MKRIFTYLTTINKNKKFYSDLPRLLTYIVTYKCNARCVMCGSWKKNDIKDLNIVEIENVFKKLPKLDIVRLSGGEPFIRKDFGDIINLTHKILKPFSLFISTNGFLTDKIISILNNRKKRVKANIIISIDGFERKHDSIRGVTGAWLKSHETIKELVKNRKNLNCNILINQTIIDEEGIDHYYKLREYFKKFGISNNIVIADKTTATYSSSSQQTTINDGNKLERFHYISSGLLNEFIAELKTDLAERSFFEKKAKGYYLDGIGNRLLNRKSSPAPPCTALNSHIRLLPDGNVPVCQFNSNTIGNLNKSPFEAVWYGRKRVKYRNWVKNCKGCWAECEVLPNAIYSGDLLKYSFISSIKKNTYFQKPAL